MLRLFSIVIHIFILYIFIIDLLVFIFIIFHISTFLHLLIVMQLQRRIGFSYINHSSSSNVVFDNLVMCCNLFLRIVVMGSRSILQLYYIILISIIIFVFNRFLISILLAIVISTLIAECSFNVVVITIIGSIIINKLFLSCQSITSVLFFKMK